jgi:hypothetical protein
MTSDFQTARVRKKERTAGVTIWVAGIVAAGVFAIKVASALNILGVALLRIVN